MTGDDCVPEGKGGGKFICPVYFLFRFVFKQSYLIITSRSHAAAGECNVQQSTYLANLLARKDLVKS